MNNLKKMTIWQTKKWQDMLKKSGQVSEFFEIDSVFVEKRQIAFKQFGLFVIWFSIQLSNETEEKLISLCKKENAVFLQIENITYENIFYSPVNDIFKNLYYKKFITPYTTVIDLKKSEDEILSEMKQKGRYNIKLAKKKGIIVEKVEKTKENIKAFYNLMLETTARDHFSANTLSYYEDFLENPYSELFLTKKDEQVISAWIFVFFGNTAIYYYGASTSNSRYRNMMAPYLLQWEAIKYAKNNWYEIYDFLWVATPDEKNSSLAWVSDFKYKFTSDVRNVSKSYIFINKTFIYSLINFVRKIKK